MNISKFAAQALGATIKHKGSEEIRQIVGVAKDNSYVRLDNHQELSLRELLGYQVQKRTTEIKAVLIATGSSYHDSRIKDYEWTLAMDDAKDAIILPPLLMVVSKTGSDEALKKLEFEVQMFEELMA